MNVGIEKARGREQGMMFFSLRNFNSGDPESCQGAEDKLVSAFSWVLVFRVYILLLLALREH